jgi:hypothetical protein
MGKKNFICHAAFTGLECIYDAIFLKSIHSPDTTGAGICTEPAGDALFIVRNIFIAVIQASLVVSP